MSQYSASLKIWRKIAVFAAALVLLHGGGAPAFAQEQGILNLGDAVVTGFSGVREPGIPDNVPDETLIDLDGISARINSLAAPAYVWDGRVWPAETARTFAARDVGQVFGVALDDAAKPNIYFTATSVYGLHITATDSDNDGRAERLKQGRMDAQWMAGMWGSADAAGGPGSIWKADAPQGPSRCLPLCASRVQTMLERASATSPMTRPTSCFLCPTSPPA